MNNPLKRGLGRGLSSLIGDSVPTKKNSSLSISSIIRNKYQPRKSFDKESLDELTNSIKERGIIQPIVVRKSKDQDNKYEIIAGERRWLAAQNAGLHEAPVVIIEADDLKSLEFAIVENVQRSDLNPIEEAQGYKRLIDEFSYDQDKVAKFIGLLNLPNEIISFIEEGKISQGHAKVLIGLDNAIFIAKKIIEKKLSVRQTESLVKALKSKSKFKSIIKDPNLKDLEDNLQDKTGIKVFIKNKKNNSGFLTFEYKDLDQLNRLIMIIKANY